MKTTLVVTMVAIISVQLTSGFYLASPVTEMAAHNSTEMSYHDEAELEPRSALKGSSCINGCIQKHDLPLKDNFLFRLMAFIFGILLLGCSYELIASILCPSYTIKHCCRSRPSDESLTEGSSSSGTATTGRAVVPRSKEYLGRDTF